MAILVTGGAGFIGGNFVLDWLVQSDEAVINLDKLTYAGNLETLASLKDHKGHIFVQGDIGDKALLDKLNAAILALRANGEYQKIQSKYFSFDIYGE